MRGVLLAITAVIAVRSASAQALDPQLGDQPPPLTNRLDAWESESRLPTACPTKPSNEVSKRPVKWGRPAESLESQAKMLEATQPTPTPAAPKVSQDEAKLPNGVPLARQSSEANTKDILTSSSKSSRASSNSRSNFAETRTAVEAIRTRQRPGGMEASEPTPNAPVFGSSRRWPPAYETKPAADSNGKAGVIIFDDDAAPVAKPTPATMAKSLPLGPADLQRKVQSVCGRQAQTVLVETQRDGTVVVKVKVPSLSVEDQLTRKIFAIPGMTAPKIRLIMDVGP